MVCKITKCAFIISLLFVMSGCFLASSPSQEEMLRDADYGRSFTQEKAQEILLENLKTMFKSYETAKIEFSELKKAFIYYEIGEKNIFGYSINAIINAQNSSGIYSGDRTHLFFLKDDKVYYNYTNPNSKYKKAYWIEVKPDISE
ncbi:MAG TPA: hypothetical protein PLK90_08975 [Clostridiales bacterium]|nr:hypothetical protein [Clostridiales bacterium]HQP70517.1 hypothetical protein [Clostridiales bacterium]